MTDEEIAGESGGMVNASRMDRGVRILSGTGVLWGGDADRSGIKPLRRWMVACAAERAASGRAVSGHR